jgi:hypothetical protein
MSSTNAESINTEQAVQVMPRIDSKGDQGFRSGDALDTPNRLSDQVGKRLVLADSNERHQVIIPGNRVHLRYPFHFAQGHRHRRGVCRFRIDQYDRGNDDAPPHSTRSLQRRNLPVLGLGSSAATSGYQLGLFGKTLWHAVRYRSLHVLPPT